MLQEIKITIGVCPNTIAALVALSKGQPVAQLSATEPTPKKTRGKKAKAEVEDTQEEMDLDEASDETEDADDLADLEELEEETEEEDEAEEETEDDEEPVKIDAKQLAQLKKALNSYSAKNGKPKAVKILHKYAKVSQDVKADDFGKIMKALKV